MTEKLELYKCNVCSNVVEVLSAGQGNLVCCGQPMELIKTETSDKTELNDKHVPVIEKVVDGFKIRIGATKHPMTEEHHINFIQAISKDGKYTKTKFLTLEDEPELGVKCNCQTLWARALCNIHGLFKHDFEE
ncbi:desulfoferrodoxin FeS4 iron-binding domain-containing protein [bacterium]|nr:desulfoferrodoxin FeS4 iron-binding domain-containing protein [bacterium]